LLDHPFVTCAGKRKKQPFILCKLVKKEGNSGRKLLSDAKKREECKETSKSPSTIGVKSLFKATSSIHCGTLYLAY